MSRRGWVVLVAPLVASLVAPLFANASAFSIFEAGAWAQDAAPERKPEDPATELARTLHAEGDKYFEARNFRKAHASYTAAWALKEHWQLAGNLGDCEFQLGDYLASARHLSFFLRDVPSWYSEDARKRAASLMVDVRKFIGVLHVRTDGTRPEIFVDGKSEGHPSVEADIFVAPGRRFVEAREGKRVAYMFVDVGASEAKGVELSLVSSAAPLDPVVEPDSSSSSAGAWVGLGFSGILIGGGILSTVYYVQKGDALGEARAAVPGVPDFPNDQNKSCGEGTLYRVQCSEVARLRQQQTLLGGLAFTGFGAGALLGVLSVVMATKRGTDRPGRTSPEVSLLVTPGVVAVGLRGSF